MEEKEEVVIVGAGLVGCLLACNLCRNMNKRVTVYERYQVRSFFFVSHVFFDFKI